LIVVYSPRYHIDIGLHVFATDKYRRVRDRIVETGVVHASDIVEPRLASWDELALVHTTEYLEKLRAGEMTAADLAQLELPWSDAMVEGFRLMVGGTIEAALCAVSAASAASACPAFSIHLGGGLHHAFPNHGEGFCPFNDVAVAARVLQTRGTERLAIVDLDVHHGNGTAFVFESDPRVFTFSMHQQHNYPMWKPRGSLDVGLPDGAHDAVYLRELERALPAVMAHRPQCVFYLAGGSVRRRSARRPAPDEDGAAAAGSPCRRGGRERRRAARRRARGRLRAAPGGHRRDPCRDDRGSRRKLSPAEARAALTKRRTDAGRLRRGVCCPRNSSAPAGFRAGTRAVT
jgi:hypothetical protein